LNFHIHKNELKSFFKAKAKFQDFPFQLVEEKDFQGISMMGISVLAKMSLKFVSLLKKFSFLIYFVELITIFEMTFA